VNIAVKVAVRIAVKFECCDAGMNKPSRLKPRHLIPVALVGLVAACVLVVSRRDSPEEIAAATAAAVAEIGPPPGEVLLSRRSDGDVAERFWEFETTAGELTAWADALPIRLGCTDVRWSVRKEARGEIAGLFKVSCMVERDGRTHCTRPEGGNVRPVTAGPAEACEFRRASSRSGGGEGAVGGGEVVGEDGELSGGEGGEVEADGDDVGGGEVDDVEVGESVEAGPELVAVACEADGAGEGGGVPGAFAVVCVAGEEEGECGGGGADDGEPPLLSLMHPMQVGVHRGCGVARHG
jgi:hypothetical protein